jgi:integrase
MKAVESYEPFTADELASIFDPESWAGYVMKGRPHYHWMPFLLAYSGARPDELAGIRLANIRREQGIDYFALKKAKNSNSIRKVPFHSEVRQSGFMAYLAQRRKDDPDGQLFPMLKPSKNGYAKNVSRRFNESYLPSLRIDDPTHRLYSFRSNFITRLSELNVNPAMVMALVGHFEQTAVDLSSPHFKNYQGAKLLGALRDTIDLYDLTLPQVF